jgi:hypothetical protein
MTARFQKMTASFPYMTPLQKKPHKTANNPYKQLKIYQKTLKN